MDKIFHNLDFKNSHNLNWFIGLYLGIPRVFMNILRKKIFESSKVTAVLIPTYTVKDPVSKKDITINLTDHYFFVGCTEDIYSETDIGLDQSGGAVILLRNENLKLSKISIEEIKKVISSNITQKYNTIQPNVTVKVTGGTFKDWSGIVETKTDTDNIKVSFCTDSYSYSTEIPLILCKVD